MNLPIHEEKNINVNDIIKNDDNLRIDEKKIDYAHSLKKHAVNIVYLSLVVISVILFFGKFLDLQNLQTGAWTLLASIVGAALYHVFGELNRNKIDTE